MIKFNGEDWKIYSVSSNHPMLAQDDGSFALGACDDPSKGIYIYEGLSLRKLKKVLCHEITHAAMFSYNVELTDEEQELIADLVATYGQEIIHVTNRIFHRIRKRERY